MKIIMKFSWNSNPQFRSRSSHARDKNVSLCSLATGGRMNYVLHLMQSCETRVLNGDRARVREDRREIRGAELREREREEEAGW